MMMLTEPLIVISCLTIALLIAMAIKNARLKDNQVFILMIPLVLTIAVIGYNFDYAANPNNDLSRFMVKHNEIRENVDKLASKVVLDCHNVLDLPSVYHI